MALKQFDEQQQQTVDMEWEVLIDLARSMNIPIEEVREFIHNCNCPSDRN